MMLAARIMFVFVACVTAAGAADRSEFANLARAAYVHCAFYKNYEIDPVNGDLVLVEGRANSLMHFQAIDLKRSRARAVYTRMAGGRDVTVLQTRKALHFIDNVAGMYLMTTVHSCIDFDEKRGVCIAYGAVLSKHFDPAALYDPDGVYEKIKDRADPGFCDHSFIDIREAAKDLR
jgi:hypothetical protein